MRKTSVGVKLYEEVHVLDFSHKILDIFLKERLTSGNADPLQDALPCTEKTKHLLCFDKMLVYIRNKTAVVTKRTEEVAPRSK